MNTDVVMTFLATQGADFALKIAGAIAAWVIGRWLIGLAVKMAGKALERGKSLDATLITYMKSIISVGMTVILILSILSIFGVQTTSFAALLAGAGLAIGAAWSGMLGNFAAGLFLQVLRPYKVGDFINAGGSLGTVKELGLLPPPCSRQTTCSPWWATTRCLATTSRISAPSRFAAWTAWPKWPTAWTCRTRSRVCAR